MQDNSKKTSCQLMSTGGRSETRNPKYWSEFLDSLRCEVECSVVRPTQDRLGWKTVAPLVAAQGEP